MNSAYVYESLRTPRAKAKADGGLAHLSPIEILGSLFKELQTRLDFDPSDVEEVVIGAARQHGDQGSNIARVATLMAGWPEHVPGFTVSRACASGLDAFSLGALKVAAGEADMVVVGGVESLSRVPMFSENSPLWNDPAVIQGVGSVHMGISADLVATREGFEREELDDYGFRTQSRAAKAQSAGLFERSIVRVEAPDGRRGPTQDEHIRPGLERADLTALEPAFVELGANGQDAIALSRFPELDAIHHVHTRGTSPSLADGGGVALIGPSSLGKKIGIAPRARIIGTASRAVNPVEMLTAGQDAVAAVVQKAGLTIDEIDRFEYAEAFGALCLKIQRDLQIPDEKFNPNGGTIAIGHAFGATGPFLMTNLIDELERSGGRYGVAAISGAAGIGVAILVERYDGSALN